MVCHDWMNPTHGHHVQGVDKPAVNLIINDVILLRVGVIKDIIKKINQVMSVKPVVGRVKFFF